MPFGTQAGLQGFRVRMASWLQERHHASFDSLKVDIYAFPLSNLNDVEQLRSVVAGRV
jgi:hypothetical protein